jgi:hypothetical protein
LDTIANGTLADAPDPNCVPFDLRAGVDIGAVGLEANAGRTESGVLIVG